MENELKEEIQNNMYITKKEFDWGCLYSTTLKSYPNKKPYYMSIRFNKEVEPDREKFISKINVKKWFLSAYEDKRDGSVKPVLFINEYEDLTEIQESPDMGFEDYPQISEDVPF